MKKITSVICMLLAMILFLGSLPVAMANTMLPEDTLMDNPRYANSFLLWVESEAKREYTPEDFPMVEDLYYVNIAKMTPTENGYQYLLFMAIDTWDLDKAKVQAGQYGGVMENYLASDYANATSRAFLNHSSVKMKVGETIDLSVIEYYLTRHRYGLEGVVFTVDPEMMDEAALVESGYQDLGIWFIYGDQEEPVLKPMYEVVGVIRESANSQKNQVSPLHSYYAVPEYGTKLITLANTLANLSGVEKVELVYGPLMYAAVMPSATYSCSPKGIVDVENVGLWDCTLTALQPGETVVTAKVWGGGYGSTTVSCNVTVAETIPESPTDIPTDTPTDVTPTEIPYGDVDGDEKVDAKDALMVLKYAVQKTDLTEAQKLVAEVDGNDGINAKDALEILKYAVEKIDTFPAQKVDNLPAVLYQFEYDGNGAPQQEDTQVILRSAGQVEEFLNVLDKAGLTNQQVTALLRGRANDKYFKNYTLLVKYNHGINGGDSGHQTIASITKEGTTAKIDAVPNFTSNGAPDARYSAWVKIADLPNDKIEGCDTFVIS